MMKKMISQHNHSLLIILFLFTLVTSCTQPVHKQAEPVHHEFTNELANEKSPYLLQHAHNPVNWLPWSEKALNKAKTEEKPILVSIGYASCHWCHVMEKESFQDIDVAQFMNDNFVCIKVDREERPDIDQIYMEAAQLLTGNGGWPLNAIALPDGRPFFAGTYFPKEDWKGVLLKISNLYKTDRDKIEGIADELTQGVKSSDLAFINSTSNSTNKSLISKALLKWQSSFDLENGGYKSTPKFPRPISWQALLHYYSISKDQKVLKQIELTLNQMATSGLYDQLGGGFARYATDSLWNIPHFEKMLYDNAQLISLYSQAYKLAPKPLYEKTVRETIAFVERELMNKSGAFYSSIDADSKGKEGEYYVWSSQEINELLGEEASWFKKFYNVVEEGNWEKGQNILYVGSGNWGSLKDVSEKEKNTKLEAAKSTLMKARAKRVQPLTDTKVLTSWNALMLKAYIHAYQAFGEEKWLKKAESLAGFILNSLKHSTSYQLYRVHYNDQASINAFLDDYALLIDGLIQLYQSTFNETWLNHALGFTNYVQANFYDQNSGYFFYTSVQDKPLFARKLELADQVIPASNSVMAKNLFYLGAYFYKESFQKQAQQMLQGIKTNFHQAPSYYANWYSLLLMEHHTFYEVAIVGTDYNELLKEMQQAYLPQAIFMGGKNEGNLELLENKLVTGETRIYVCRNKSCKLPVKTTEKALQQMK